MIYRLLSKRVFSDDGYKRWSLVSDTRQGLFHVSVWHCEFGPAAILYKRTIWATFDNSEPFCKWANTVGLTPKQQLTLALKYSDNLTLPS